MHENIIESGVFAQRGYDFAQRYSVTSKRTIVNAVMSAKTTDDALNLAIVENPIVYTSAPSIELFSYRVWQRSADTNQNIRHSCRRRRWPPSVCWGNGLDRGCIRAVRVGEAVACRCCRRRRTAAIRAARDESRPCSYAKVHQHVAIVIQFDDVVELHERDYGHRLRKCVGERFCVSPG